jgi:hypothetical protein
MSIGAEALVAQIGILPARDEMLTKEDGRDATKLPEMWRAEVRAWLAQSKPKRFTLCRQYHFERTLNALSNPLPTDLFSQLQDAGKQAECRATLERSRAYALAHWPVRYLDRPTGQQILQPGQIELLGACAILAVLDDPDRMVDELRMETLEETQVEAFKANFPDLHEMLVAIVWEEIDRRALDKDYFMLWGTELTFRRLIGMPPEMAISDAKRPEPSAGKPTIKADFSSLKTRAQKLQEK